MISLYICIRRSRYSYSHTLGDLAARLARTSLRLKNRSQSRSKRFGKSAFFSKFLLTLGGVNFQRHTFLGTHVRFVIKGYFLRDGISAFAWPPVLSSSRICAGSSFSTFATNLCTGETIP